MEIFLFGFLVYIFQRFRGYIFSGPGTELLRFSTTWGYFCVVHLDIEAYIKGLKMQKGRFRTLDKASIPIFKGGGVD